ncbi:allantoicase [Nocardia sp. NEAU-G5]|uniref:Probable allantoicase n=1 Tax=Nocardia albiluteola TaxID=2842303 RepID=A0ABS6AX45_9NOCA|nr:allantoicase [Nocardia albiluteola]MBU3062632.1 allantoicase [Nocardia albiluteola]MBU3065534.1 allantoicase [Nocardia albiluteola]
MPERSGGVSDWSQLPDLASRQVGGSVVAANDEFFAERENLIKDAAPVYQTHTFNNKGQVYDGWETRRRRDGSPGPDWALIRLGVAGVVSGIVVDTAFFIGNFPPHVSIEGASVPGHPSVDELLAADWHTLVPVSPVEGDSRNLFEASNDRRITHVRVNMHPDGGIARVRVHGTAVPDPQWIDDIPFDLAALRNGGRAVACSDGFFSPPNNMLQPGISRFMADGWETRRRRDDGNDWATVALAAEAVPAVLELDTTHYKGNSPARISLDGYTADGELVSLLEPTALQPDATHRFRLTGDRPVNHVRLNVLPDGGVARLRLFGRITPAGREQLESRFTATTPDH